MLFMEVVFRRLSDRQYAIGVIRDGVRDVGGDVAMRLAPGDTDVPHDLVHFVVEEQAELTLGIFGQCAAGGDVGGFFRATIGKRGKARRIKRSRRLGGAGRSQVDRSEVLASLARDGAISPEVDPATVSPTLRESINGRLDAVMTQWNGVPVGGDLVLHWPAHLTIRRGRL